MKNSRKLLLFSFLVLLFSNAMARKVQVLVGPDSFSPSEITLNSAKDSIYFLLSPNSTYVWGYTIGEDYTVGVEDFYFDCSRSDGRLTSEVKSFYYYPIGNLPFKDYTFRAEFTSDSSKPFFYLTVHYGTTVEDHNHTINLGNSVFSPSTQIVATGDTVKIKYADTNGDSYYITAPSGLSFSSGFLTGGELDLTEAVKNATPGDYIITAQNFADATVQIKLTLRIQAATGVDNYKLDKVSIAPNPVGELLSVKGLDKAAILSLYNLGGVLQIQKQLPVGNANVAVSSLSAGVYVVKLVTADGGYFESKIVKE